MGMESEGFGGLHSPSSSVKKVSSRAENLPFSPLNYPKGSSSWSRSPRIQPSSFPLPKESGSPGPNYHPDDAPGKEQILHKTIPSISISRTKNNAIFWKIVEAKSSILPGPFEYSISDAAVGNFGSSCQKPRNRRSRGTLPRSERPTDQYMGWTPPGAAHYCPGIGEPPIPKVGTHFRHKYGRAIWFGKPLLDNPHARSQWLLPKAPTTDTITSLGGGAISLHSLWEDTICAVEADLNKVGSSGPMAGAPPRGLPPRAPSAARVASAAAARSTLSSGSVFDALERPLSAATPSNCAPSSGTKQRNPSLSPSKTNRSVTPSTVLASSTISSPAIAGGGISRSRREVSELPGTCHVTPGPGDYNPSYVFSSKQPALWEEPFQSPLTKHRLDVRKNRKVQKPIDRFFYLP